VRTGRLVRNRLVRTARTRKVRSWSAHLRAWCELAGWCVLRVLQRSGVGLGLRSVRDHLWRRGTVVVIVAVVEAFGVT
jgi:hypothetical protein